MEVGGEMGTGMGPHCGKVFLVTVGIVSAIGEDGSEEVNRNAHGMVGKMPTEWWGDAHGSLRIQWGDDGNRNGPPLWESLMIYGWNCQVPPERTAMRKGTVSHVVNEVMECRLQK
jgi:hypothetical protein